MYKLKFALHIYINKLSHIEKFLYSKIVEREDELFIVQNIVKSLEVSEEKVT